VQGPAALKMAAAFIQAKRNQQRCFKEAITAQEEGVEQYRTDKFQRVTSFRRPLNPLHIDTNVSAENATPIPEVDTPSVSHASIVSQLYAQLSLPMPPWSGLA
jgi:hypothetical protein